MTIGSAHERTNESVTLSDPIDLTKDAQSGTLSVYSKNTITVSDKVVVSKNPQSSSGGTIILDSRKTNGIAISIGSSAQLLSLLSAVAPGPGGDITFASAGGAVNVSGKIQADRGSIVLRNSGPAGAVALTNATLNGSVIKVGALGSNGQLNIGGGAISADSKIKLYATGSNGQVNFTDNVTLSGNSTKTIAGDTVTISNGKIVTVNGPAPADVFTNHPNYTGSGGNGSTSGVFAGKGAATQPFGNLPPGF
jgi:hypothetical protein